MDCQEIQKKLEAFLDSELNPQEGKIISDHLESCPVCQAEWEALCKMDSLVAENQGLDPGEEAWQRMRDGIDRAITPGKVRHRAGIMERLSWLLSPRYAVVKAGAVVAVAVMAFVVSRQITMEQITPSTSTIPEHAISDRPVEQSEHTVLQELATEQLVEGEMIDTTSKSEVPVILKSAAGEPPLKAPSPELDRKLQVEEPPTLPSVYRKDETLSHEEDVAEFSEDMSIEPPAREKRLDRTVEDVRDALRTLPGVHVDQEGEFHFRGGRSSEVSEVPPQEAKKSQMDISIKETQEGMTLGSTSSRGAGVSKDRMTFQTETTRHLSVESDPVLTAPFSHLSYWEEYQVSITTDLVFPTQADSLWHEYRRCEGKSCRLEVIPYLAGVLFRQALQDRNQEAFENLKPLMETYRERLEDSWGKQRYQVRWEKLLELAN